MHAKISIGRIVHAVIKNAHGVLVVRPAIVTRTWGTDSVQATVFPDVANDGLGSYVAKSSLQHSEATGHEDTWHWPQPEPAPVPPVDWNALHQQVVDLCHAIAEIPASAAATAASVQAAALRGRIHQLSTAHQ